jgi:hypothetical protein
LIDEYNLTEWEPALSTSVCSHQHYKFKNIMGKDYSKVNIEKNRKNFFENSKYDGLLAIKINKQ